MKVLVITRSYDDFSELRTIFPDHEFRILPMGSETSDDLAWADIMSGNPPPQSLSHAKNLKWFHIGSAGVDGYNDRSLYPASCVVTRSADTFSLAMSEWLLGSMLILSRRFPLYASQQAERLWQREPNVPEHVLHGATVVFAGCGSIASATLGLLAPFGCRTVGVRRDTSKGAGGYNEVVTTDRLHEALSRADFIVNTLPHTAATALTFDAAAFAAAKRGAYYLNVGRGTTNDQSALHDALVSGRLAGAALDVTDPEPLPSDHPLWDAPNLIITPHISGFSTATDRLRLDSFIDQFRTFLSGDEMPFVLDFTAGY